MSILICEIGNILSTHIGLTENVTSDADRNYGNIPIKVMEKAELYSKLGINPQDFHPDITIISNLEHIFGIENSKLSMSNILPIIKLDPDLLIVDSTNYKFNRSSTNTVLELFDNVIEARCYETYGCSIDSCLYISGKKIMSSTVVGNYDKSNKCIYNQDEIDKQIADLREYTTAISFKIIVKVIR